MKQILIGAIISLTLAMYCPALIAQDLNKVKIVDFGFRQKENKVFLKWSTESDETINYFEIEKSIDGIHFKPIAIVMGPDPSSNEKNIFGGFDKLDETKNEIYYRLKHLSEEGTEEYSEVKLFNPGSDN